MYIRYECVCSIAGAPSSAPPYAVGDAGVEKVGEMSHRLSGGSTEAHPSVRSGAELSVHLSWTTTVLFVRLLQHFVDQADWVVVRRREDDVVEALVHLAQQRVFVVRGDRIGYGI
uniref:Uncharacterized protein n=1 Tax=Plectus sambesii TaxID=2011161 RepID=A0A914W5S9_9BILA